MNNKIRVLGISGSLRKASFNTALLRAAGDMLPTGMTLEIADLSQIPLYSGDIEAAGIPVAVRQLHEQILAADALLIATPEHNYSVSAALKNTIDWATRPANVLSGKPTAILGAGGGMGTSRAQYHLRQVAVYTNMLPVNKPEVFVTNARSKFDEDGVLTDQPTRDVIGQLLESLAAWTRQLRAENLVSQ